jgi:putative hydrolase of the HAD superfamily
MAELMGELKDLGFKLYLFANADRAIHAYAHRIPGAKYFDGLFASSDWKLLQPEPAIYDAFLGKFGLTSWECLLIDNSPANVDGARRADMDAVLFRGDMGRLRSELNALGVGVKTGTEG